MDPVVQLLLLLAGFGLYAWADRHRLISLARPYLAPLQRVYGTIRQEIGAGRPFQTPPSVSPNRALLADGRRLLLVGAPGSGKSTAAREIIRAYHNAGAQVLILDPEGAAWPDGARMIGAADDYPAIAHELEQLAQLASVRRQAFHQGRRDFDPLLLVIDEAPAVLRSTPGALEIVADLARRGRKLAISIILLSQDTQAKTLGIEGQTRLLDAFDRLDCRMSPAGVELLKEGIRQQVAPLDYHLNDLVLPTIDELRPSTPDADRLLSAALAEPPTDSNTINARSTVIDPIAIASTPIEGALINGVNQGQNPAESLPPALIQRLNEISWKTVAELVAAGVVSETNALRALGFTPGGTSQKYLAARTKLQAARSSQG